MCSRRAPDRNRTCVLLFTRQVHRANGCYKGMWQLFGGQLPNPEQDCVVKELNLPPSTGTPLPHSMRSACETRTHTYGDLNPVPLPIGLRRHKTPLVCVLRRIERSWVV